MATIKKNDFVEIEYTGTLKAENAVFDTTRVDIAKKNRFFREEASYGPLVVCVGEQFLIKGLDDFLIGKEIGKEYSVDISPEQGFGKKDGKLLQMIPESKFKQSKVQPFPGLQVNIDGTMGIIKTVSGGRVMVDFNHPLAGRELSYAFKVITFIDDEKRKVDAYLKHLGMENLNTSADNGILTIRMKHKIEQVIEKEFATRIKRIIPTIKEVKFVEQKQEEKDDGQKKHGSGHQEISHEGQSHHN